MFSISTTGIGQGEAPADRTRVQERMLAVLSTAFTSLGLLFGCAGLYRLMSFGVIAAAGPAARAARIAPAAG